jgi:hypothetical protein
MLGNVFSDLVPVLALALTCHRAWWHGTACLGTDSVVPRPVVQHRGTNMHDTNLLSYIDVSYHIVLCLVVLVLVSVPCRAARLAIYICMCV